MPNRNTHNKLWFVATRTPSGNYVYSNWYTMNNRKTASGPRTVGAGEIIKINGVNYKVGATRTPLKNKGEFGNKWYTNITRVQSAPTTNYSYFRNALMKGRFAPGIRRFGS